MSATAANTIDVCHVRLHGRGFSIGDMAVRTAKGTMWVVFAYRGHERVVAKARRQASACREASGWRCGPMVSKIRTLRPSVRDSDRNLNEKQP